jgi:uncharacterized membrane protein
MSGNINGIMIIFILVSAILASVGALFLKKGSKHFRVYFKFRFILDVLKNYILLFGIILYGLSTIVFILALRLGELSVVYPLTSLSYVFVCFLSVYFLRERMNWYKWLGIAFIILGVVLVKF